MPEIDWTLSSKVEHAVARIISKQEANGVVFNLPLAEQLIRDIDIECEDIYRSLRPHLSYEVVVPYPKPVTKLHMAGKTITAYQKSGGLKEEASWGYEGLFWGKFCNVEREVSTAVKSWGLDNVAGEFSRIEFTDPDIGSREKFKKQLLRLGWKPRHFTEKGSPQLTIKNEFDETVACPSLEETLGDLGISVARLYVIRHRQSQIRGFLKHIRPDGRISAGANPDATNTHRMAHRRVANVPRASSILGKEMRSLFTVPTGYVMVGADLSGLELRCLAHRMNDPTYTDVILNKDIHIYNQEAAKLSTRDQAKKFIYTFLYGGGDSKVGQSIGGKAKDGKKIKSQFLKSLPSLDILIKRVKKASRRGYLVGLDGRKIWMRADHNGKVMEHKALNTLLQCDGSLIMKMALLYMDKNIFSNPRWDAKLLITYHDEVQLEVREDQAEAVGKLIVRCFEQAGTFFKLNCPITGEFAIGKSWAETH